MTKEFNLSNEMQDYAHDSFRLDDVKKFIRLLKKELRNHTKMHYHAKRNCIQVIREKIDKLAGEKFTKNEK